MLRVRRHMLGSLVLLLCLLQCASEGGSFGSGDLMGPTDLQSGCPPAITTADRLQAAARQANRRAADEGATYALSMKV